jgi:8-amino-3,8-dideoxy-alpha-D-manno-octulosonate transaminase
MEKVSSLAINGGAPARSRPDEAKVTRLGTAEMGAAEIAAISRVLEDRVLFRHHGHTVKEFETAFADFLGGGPEIRTLAVNSGSTALQLALASLGVESGDEVLVPSMGFLSVATAVQAVGATPRFVPVDRSLTLDVAAAADLVTPRTRAVLAVHAYGSSSDMAGILRLADGGGLFVLEDAAQACGATYRGRRVGTFGHAATFSFQDFKLISTGEGGMVVTQDLRHHDRAVYMHDVSTTWNAPEVAARVGAPMLAPGNVRMSELEGAIGLVQLRRWEESTARLRAAKAPLQSYLSEVRGIVVREHWDPAGELATHLVFYVDSSNSATWIAAALRAEGVKADPLLSAPGRNRNWAGDWGPILARHDPPATVPPEIIERDLETLGSGVVIYIDLSWSETDGAQTLLALTKVCP